MSMPGVALKAQKANCVCTSFTYLARKTAFPVLITTKVKVVPKNCLKTQEWQDTH